MDWLGLKSAFSALLPDARDLWLLGYIVALAIFAWLESRYPASDKSSSRTDRWFTNFGIGAFTIALATLTPVSAVIAAEWAAREKIGLLNAFPLPWTVGAAVTVFARSLIGYGFHVLLHKVPLLWRVHRVHHSDLHVDVSTALRSHPAEYIALLFVVVPAAIALGFNPVVLAIFETIDASVNLAGHMNVRLPERLDRALRVLFVTPNMHSIHHSSWHRETDSNYGNVFSIWDHIFRTYRGAPRDGYDGMQIGLKEIRDGRAADLFWQLKSPALNFRADRKSDAAG